MKHPSTRLLHAYWNWLRGEPATPGRSKIELGAIHSLLTASMILKLDPPCCAVMVRLSGTRVYALYGRN